MSLKVPPTTSNDPSPTAPSTEETAEEKTNRLAEELNVLKACAERFHWAISRSNSSAEIERNLRRYAAARKLIKDREK